MRKRKWFPNRFNANRVEQSTTTVCSGVNLQESCVGGEIIAVQSVNYGTKLTASCDQNDNSAGCCTYDGADCILPTYSSTEQHAACRENLSAVRLL